MDLVTNNQRHPQYRYRPTRHLHYDDKKHPNQHMNKKLCDEMVHTLLR